MAQEPQLYIKCVQCGGTGTYINPGVGGGSQACQWPGCADEPVGFIPAGKIILDPGNDDVIDKCNDILDKCNDILEEISE